MADELSIVSEGGFAMSSKLFTGEELKILDLPEPICRTSDFDAAMESFGESADRIPYEQIRDELCVDESTGEFKREKSP